MYMRAVERGQERIVLIFLSTLHIFINESLSHDVIIDLFSLSLLSKYKYTIS